MKTKWYISTLVIVIAFLGICNNQISLPNQEILVQFNTDEVTIEQSQNAIEVIKHRLQYFGIESFHIQEGENGDLKISYHSSINVESIKKALSDEHIGIDFTSLHPNKNNQNSYNLDIYELQASNDSNNSAGKFVWIVKQDYNRFLDSNPHPTPYQTYITDLAGFENPTNNVTGDIAIAIENTSHIIPEVRAGPKTYGNS